MTESRDDLASATVRGVGWTAGAQLGKQVAQMALSIGIARLLLPSAFGQMEQILVLAGLANLLADFGFGAALVQRKELTEEHRSSVFWVQLALGLAVTGVLVACAPLIAGFYRQPPLRGLTMLLAPNFLLLSVCTVPRSLLTRSMRFRALAFIDVSTLVIGGVVAIGMAWAGFGVVSIVVSTLVNSACTALMLLVASPWKPRLILHRQSVKDLLPFSRNLLGFSFVNYTIRNSDNLLVGRLLGAVALGLYDRGYSILLYPNRQISSVVGNVMFASMSRIHDDTRRLRRVYLRTIGAIALITFPVMAGLALTAHEFVPVVLGRQWVAAVPIIQIFCVLGASESITTTIGWIYQATGRTDVLLRWALVVGGVPLIGIVTGALMGSIEAVTIGYAVCTTLLLYPAYRWAGKLIGLTFSEVVRAVAQVALCTAAMAVVVTGVALALPAGMAPAVRLAAKSAAGGVTYLALVHFGKVKAYVDLRDTVMEQLKRRRMPVASAVTPAEVTP